MVNWIAGNWPDRFRCLVSHDGNLDERDGLLRHRGAVVPRVGARAARRGTTRRATRKHNPIDHVAELEDADAGRSTAARTSASRTTQGLAVFTALQRRGIPSKLLYFPDENHWVLKPANSVLWHETVLAWLERWLKK